MERVDIMFEPLRASLIQIGEFLPRLLLAVIILLAGWILAKFVRFVVSRGLRAINFHVLTERAGIDNFWKQGGVEMDTTGLIAGLAFWLAIIAAVMVAFNSLGLAHVTELTGKALLFIPKVIAAVVILTLGAYFARIVAGAVIAYCRTSGIADAELLGRIAQWTVMVFVIVIVLDEISIGADIIRQSFLIILAGGVLALALAFGIGGQKLAADWLERWRTRGEVSGNDRLPR